MSEFQTITLTKIFKAPRALVYQAWLEPKHILHWYRGSADWTTPFAESDAKNGGTFRIGFGSPDGKNDFTFEGVYNELIENEKIVFTIGDGRPVVITLKDAGGGKTELTLVLSLETTHSADQQREGWGTMLHHLDLYLGSL